MCLYKVLCSCTRVLCIVGALILVTGSNGLSEMQLYKGPACFRNASTALQLEHRELREQTGRH